jgi:hypothetical protein
MYPSDASIELTRTFNNVSPADDQDDTDVCYLQSQNGNIWDRFKEEAEDDPPELSRFQEYVLRGPRVMQKLCVCRAQRGRYSGYTRLMCLGDGGLRLMKARSRMR